MRSSTLISLPTHTKSLPSIQQGTMSQQPPIFHLRIRDIFGEPAHWPYSLTYGLFEVVRQSIRASVILKRAVGRPRAGTNQPDLNFTNVELVREIVGLYLRFRDLFVHFTMGYGLNHWEYWMYYNSGVEFNYASRQALAAAEHDVRTLSTFLEGGERFSLTLREAMLSGHSR